MIVILLLELRGDLNCNDYNVGMITVLEWLWNNKVGLRTENWFRVGEIGLYDKSYT